MSNAVVLELRAARPRAPETLRERVLAIGEPQPRFALPAWRLRRVALVAVPACLAVAVGGALIHGALNAGSPSTPVAVHGEDVGPLGPARPTTHRPRSADSTAQTAGLERVPLPNPSRLQDYRASLTVRVDSLDDLSSATQQAMRTARRLGGYVVTARYGAAKNGRSLLVVRVPIGKVQRAIASFSGLGTIVAQDIKITDLQNRVDVLERRIDGLRVRIAKIDDRLLDSSLTNEQRVRLELERARLAQLLHRLVGTNATLVHRASLSTVSLGLTTRKAAVVPHHRGAVGNALHDAGTILAKEGAIALYVLIVAGPLLVLAGLIWIAARAGRRYSDRRLLESS